MRAPSAAKLIEAFPELSKQQANLIRKLAKAADSGEELQALVESGALPHTQAYVRELYGSPYTSERWRVTVALTGMDEILGTYGIESFKHKGRRYEYLNSGDTYNTTLIYDRGRETFSGYYPNDRLIISDMGTIVENPAKTNSNPRKPLGIAVTPYPLPDSEYYAGVADDYAARGSWKALLAQAEAMREEMPDLEHVADAFETRAEAIRERLSGNIQLASSLEAASESHLDAYEKARPRIERARDRRGNPRQSARTLNPRDY